MEKNNIETSTLPLYVEAEITKPERKDYYINMGLSLYKGIEKLTTEEYKQIKKEIESGNNSKFSLLFEKSIYDIIVSLANIYSNYDIESVLPYSDYLSQVILDLSQIITNIKELPNAYSKYKYNLINLYVYGNIAKHYNKQVKNIAESMPVEKIAWLLDKVESEEFSYKDIGIQELRKEFNKVFCFLDSRQTKLLKMRVGWDSGIPMTIDEIATVENISRGRAFDILVRALNNIRKNIKHFKGLKNYYNVDLNTLN